MACVVGPTDAGMSKFDKGNITKVFRVWSERIDKELEINVSTDRHFRVAHMPSIMPQKVNNWDPTKQKLEDPKTLEKSVKFDYPPPHEITDIKYVGVQAFPRERFGIPQSEYHKIGWMQTPAEFRTKFAVDLLDNKKDKTTTFSTGLSNMRDDYWRTQQRPKVKNPMAHHVGYITGLGDNPYERTIKHPERLNPVDPLTQEWKAMKKKDRKMRKKVEEAGFEVAHRERTEKKKKKMMDVDRDLLADAEVEIASDAATPSIVSSNMTDMVKAQSQEQIFQLKTENCHNELLKKYGRWRSIAGNKKWFHPLSNSDVTLFADEYTKQMLTGPHMKTQPLVSR
ncbi:unnamed protein product [Amoebophrya sp. A120]|nr:unnamed protein product [Amoebophrya sp. A120]|eukprot:GSA120T00018712001.1